MKKWYSYSTMFKSMKEELAAFLRRAKIQFEISGDRAAWYFSILVSPAEAEAVNNWIHDNTITEVK